MHRGDSGGDGMNALAVRSDLWDICLHGIIRKALGGATQDQTRGYCQGIDSLFLSFRFTESFRRGDTHEIRYAILFHNRKKRVTSYKGKSYWPVSFNASKKGSRPSFRSWGQLSFMTMTPFSDLDVTHGSDRHSSWVFLPALFPLREESHSKLSFLRLESCPSKLFLDFKTKGSLLSSWMSEELTTWLTLGYKPDSIARAERPSSTKTRKAGKTKPRHLHSQKRPQFRGLSSDRRKEQKSIWYDLFWKSGIWEGIPVAFFIRKKGSGLA